MKTFAVTVTYKKQILKSSGHHNNKARTEKQKMQKSR